MVEDPREEALRLTSRVASGDPDAQRAFVLRLLQGVRRTAASLLRSDPEVDDAMQMAMIEILRSAATYRGDASLEHWARRIAVRTTLHLLRERRARTRRLDLQTEPDATEALAHDAADVSGEAVEAYLAQLSESRRTCIVLRHVHGYTVEEIAGLTDVSANTVKDRLLQGRAQLRKLVRRDEATARVR